MSPSKKVLPQHLDQAKLLISFLNYCIVQQKRAAHANDSYGFEWWIKEARLARRELNTLYEAKRKHDEQMSRVKRIVECLQRRGIRCEAVKRAHEIADEELAQ